MIIRSKKGIIPIVAIVVAIIVVGAIGGGYYIYNENQKSITGQAISDLKSQLDEQNEILEEQTQLTVEQQAQAEVEKERLASQIEELSKETCKDVQVPYDAPEEYTEPEPYLRPETYYVKEPYPDEKCTTTNLTYNADYTKCSSGGLFSDPEVIVTVNNLDSSKGGSFIFWVGFNLKDGNQVGQEITQYIYPSSSKQFRYTADIGNFDSCQYLTKNIPTRTDCETFTNYKDVAKIREVTDYKDVTKTRTVTKYKTETVCE